MTEYTPESLDICKRVVRTINAESGVWGPKCVVIGGLVPALLGIEPPEGLAPHLGTTDVDLAIQIAAVRAEADLYRTLRSVLGNLGFKQTAGQPSFAWVREVDGLPAKIELFCPVSDRQAAGRIQKQPFDESGSGLTALGVYGLELMERDLVTLEDEGRLLDDRGIKRVSISVCGPAMLMLLKAWALGERTKEKDGYDIVWLLRALGVEPLASRFSSAGLSQTKAGARAVEFLAEAFGSPDSTGSSGWVTTAGFEGDERELEKRNAVGIVREFCRLCHQPNGSSPTD